MNIKVTSREKESDHDHQYIIHSKKMGIFPTTNCRETDLKPMEIK